MAEKSKLQKDYATYFQKQMDDFGVDSPADLSDEEKIDFFKTVKKGWTKGKGEKK